MTSADILSLVTLLYCAMMVLYLTSWLFRQPGAGKAAHAIGWVGFSVNAVGLLLRWYESHQLGFGHAPLSNLYESLIFFSMSVTALFLIVERKYGNQTIGAFVSPLAFLAIAYASLSPSISDHIRPLIPALKSNWLFAHVITCFIGYSGFATAFGLSIMFLLRQRKGGDSNGLMAKLPEPALIDELTHRMVLFGFLFLSIGIITGAVWANSAWGRYWGWDPKETWSLITWFIYATLLHARLMRGWSGNRIAYLSISGFIAVLFTYFGVNLLPGLHSYGSMGG
jgi:cytochrome c-type biogenesis protein CcsB